MVPISMPRKLVVAGLVLNENNHVLLSQRPKTTSHPLEWELPGGQLELGENPKDGLRRELLEELGLNVQVGRIWEVLHYHYPQFELLMLIYVCRPLKNESPQLIEAAAVKWLNLDELVDHPILEADRSLVHRLLNEGIPTQWAP